MAAELEEEPPRSDGPEAALHGVVDRFRCGEGWKCRFEA